MLDNDSGKAGIGGGFSDAEKKTAQKKRGESTREASEKSGRGPDGESDGENFCGGKTIGEPAGENQKERVSPEERGEKDAELRRGNGEFAFERGDSDGESAAVDVGDEEGEEEKDQDGPESGREFFGWRGGVQGAEIVQQEAGLGKARIANGGRRTERRNRREVPPLRGPARQNAARRKKRAAPVGMKNS